MARKAKNVICAHRLNIMQPCFQEDGEKALRNGVCMGCNKTPDELKADDSKIPVGLEPAIKKMNRLVNVHASNMKAMMTKALVEGKLEGWDTKPAWEFADVFDECVDNIRDGKNITSATTSISVIAMLIGMRQK